MTNLRTYETPRHLKIWHDDLSISAHSHLLMISCLYNQTCHLTDIEFKERHGVVINVQSMVENPEIYILARYPSNNQQILYCEDRYEDLLSSLK